MVLLFFGRSPRSLSRLRLNARGRSDYFLGRLAHGGVRGVRPGTRRPRTHGGTTRVFSSLFRLVVAVVFVVFLSSSSSFCVETTHHPSIDRSIDRCRLALLDTARDWRTETRGGGSSLASLARSQIILITFSSSFIIHQKQKALRAVESVAALEMLEKLFGNVAKNPSEKKYRRVKFETNAKIKAAFESGKCTSEIALRCFLTHGWVVEEEENNERVVKLPDSVQQSFRDVREVTERKEALQKELQAAFRRRVAARSKAAASGEKETLLRQLEADKLERAAKGPVTEGSKRVDGALGNGGFSTPQDIGCSGSA